MPLIKLFQLRVDSLIKLVLLETLLLNDTAEEDVTAPAVADVAVAAGVAGLLCPDDPPPPPAPLVRTIRFNTIMREKVLYGVSKCPVMLL